jgi:uncharacterized membrane protein YhhN
VTIAVVIAVIAASVNWATRLPNPPAAAASPWVEWLSKPLTTAALLAVAVLIDPADPAQRTWFVIGLALCLAGDVALMLPTELFRTGLVSFLLGHLAFIVGFILRGVIAPAVVVAVGATVLVLCLTVGFRHLLPTVRSHAPELLAPVTAYITVIASMGVASIWGQHWAAPLGAATFAVSDLTLADNKFVAARTWSPLAVMVTYHLALALLVVSLTG